MLLMFYVNFKAWYHASLVPFFGSCELCVFWPFFGFPFLSPLWWFRPSIFYWVFVVFLMQVSNKEDDSLTIGIAHFFHHYGYTWCFCVNSFKTWWWRGIHFFSILFLFSFYVLHFQVWNDVLNDFYVQCVGWTSICTILHNQRCLWSFMPSLFIVVQVSNKVNLIAIDVAWIF
jgi:hypothetical protein